MDNKYASRFLIGALFGVMIGVIVWYWQKSTSAENGALALLDRLGAAEARLRELKVGQGMKRQVVLPDEESVTTPAVKPTPESDAADDLTQVRGIGPVFEARLNQAGIQTINQLSAISITRLAAILDVADSRAEAILAETSQLSA